MSTIGLLGVGERLSVPLTWGGTRRAALEFDRTFKRGPLTRVESSVGIWQRENPRFELDDQRVELKGRAERRVRAGAEGRHLRLAQLGRLRRRRRPSSGRSARTRRIDTRADPTFPRNAVFLGTGGPACTSAAPPTAHRPLLHGRARLRRASSARPWARSASSTRPPRRACPTYERLLLGGASTLRGFRAGTFDGDRPLVTSAELRVPMTLGAEQRATGRASASSTPARRGTRPSAPPTAPGTTASAAACSCIAPLVRLNLDVAHGLTDGDTRVHLGVGFAF